MLCFPCPHCGDRYAAEFAYVGERVARPDAGTATPEQWRSYLYTRRNPAGWADELWLHRAGCGQYLAVTRDTRTGQIRDCSSITTDGGGG
jgi:sarcosine oxidase subunit delta